MAANVRTQYNSIPKTALLARWIILENAENSVISSHFRPLSWSGHCIKDNVKIDPPYNTGNDFVYNDSFGVDSGEWNGISNDYDEDGNQIVGKLEKNQAANGRFHTDWLNMIYPRLKLAKDLLSEDGVIFISIDDNEVENLRKVCDEVFGTQNFIAQCIRRTINSGKHDTTTIAPFHEYVVMYAKNTSNIMLSKKPKDEAERDRLYKEKDEFVEVRGRYYVTQLNKNSLQYSDGLNYPITGPDGVDIWPGGGFNDKVWIWRWSKSKVLWGIENGYIVFKKVGDKYKVYTKSYEYRDKDGKPINRNNPYSTLEFIAKEYANFNATPEIEKLFDGKKYFDFPKSMVFMKELVKIANLSKDDVVLDFFSGSATTAHAVMQLNAEEIAKYAGEYPPPNIGKRKFIMVQLPEETDEKSEAYKAGYKNICEIGKERIRRAGKKIKEETGADIDYGFRVLKCDSSNMRDVYYNPDEYEQDMFDVLKDNIKDDRTAEDLLFQVMLDLGILLSEKIEERNICGHKVYVVNPEENYLYACFDDNISDDVVTAIAKQEPYYCVIRDSSMANDSVMTNFDQIFKTISPDTERRVL